MRFKFLMISITKCPYWSKVTETHKSLSNMKQFQMSNSPDKNEVLIKQYMGSISTGAIIGDGDRKRLPFLVLGLSYDMGQFFDFWNKLRHHFAAHAR